MESDGESVSIFVHRNEAGVGTDNNCVIKIHSGYENGQKAPCASSLSRVTLKFKKVTLHYSGRAALPNNTAASNTSSLHTAAAAVLLTQPTPHPSPSTLLPR